MKAYSFRGRAWRPKRQLALAAIPLRLAVDVYASSFEGVLHSLTHSITLHANTLSNYFFFVLPYPADSPITCPTPITLPTPPIFKAQGTYCGGISAKLPIPHLKVDFGAASPLTDGA